MKVLYAPARQRVPSKAFEWSNGTYSLLLDKLELDFTVSEEVTLLLEATTLEEDCFTSSLLLDLASEEDGFTEELDSFAFSSDEEDFSLLEFFCDEEDWTSSLDVEMTEDEDSSDGSGDTEDEEESPPQAARTNNTAKMEHVMKLFIKPPNFIFFEI